MHELEELGYLALGTDPDDETLDLDDMLYDDLGITFDQFAAVVERLARFTPVMQIATLDGREEYARGFVHDGAFIVKQLVGKS